MTDLADVAAAKAMHRIIPLVIVCYFFAYLDRGNMGFAKLQMADDLHLSPAAFGWAFGIFFTGYFIFEVPSNLLLERFGARRWIARIMISWGLIAAAMAFVWSETSLYVLRFIFGIAEAGFFPGIILYLTYWFPQQLRGKIIGSFMIAVPISAVIGNPLSSWLLHALDGVSGLRGWQWLFIIEGLPTCILGLMVLFVLADGPAKAPWLTAEEREALSAKLAEERRRTEAVRHFSLREALTSPRVLALGVVYFGAVAALYVFTSWLPTIVKEAFPTLIDRPIAFGVVTAIPAALGAFAMVLWGRHSDMTGERNWHVALPCLICAVALLASGVFQLPVTQMVGLTIASAMIYCIISVFWTLPTSLLTGTAAAGGIAFICAIGNLGGLVGPAAVGQINQWTGRFAYAYIFIGVLTALSGIIVLVMARYPMSAVAPRVAAGVSR